MKEWRPIMLVLRPLGLGDLLTVVPALRALTTAFPRHRRVLATTRALAPLALASGLADDVLPSRPHAPLEWRDYRPAVAVNLHGRGWQSHGVLLEARPARLIAFAHPLVRESWSGPAWRVEEHEVRRWCRLLDESGIDADPAALDLDLPSRPTPAEAIDATILHPGGASPARRWPPERWAAVAAAERGMGRTVLLTGTMAERALAFAIARDAGLPPSAVFAGRTDVLALAALVRRAGRVVCGDTCIAHLATALRTPSVVLFGPTPPSLWGPPAERPWHRALWCGTRGDPHATRPDDGLLQIGVGDVLAALAALPDATPRREDGVRRRRRVATARPSPPRTLRRVEPGR